jgi:hypothetical protein
VEAQPAERRQRVERRDNWYFYAPFADGWSRQEGPLQAGSRAAERADVVIDNSAPRPDANWPDRFPVRSSRSGGRS